MPEAIKRQREVMDSRETSCQVVNGRRMLSFCSNDYLGLSSHPDIIQAATEILQDTGMGSRSSALLSGYSSLHQQLESELAYFFGFERTLLFSTGYMANLGLLSTLLSPTKNVLMERRVHASIIDGVTLSGAHFKRYRSLPLTSKADVIITEGVFSMDGDFSPLHDYPTDKWVVVDDAHAIGRAGAHGAGSFDYHQVPITKHHITVGTLSKSSGCHSGFVAGSEELIESLVQHSRPYIYTTAPPPHMVAAALASLRVIKNEACHRQRLLANIAYFRQQAGLHELDIYRSHSPIQIIEVGPADLTVHVKECLKKQDILVQAIRPPTVPTHHSRLRISLSAAHNTLQIDQLCEALPHVLT